MPRIFIREDRCKGCGLCKEACPKRILEFSQNFNSKGYHPMFCLDQSKCIGCGACARTCPDVAIEVFKEVSSKTRRPAYNNAMFYHGQRKE